MYEVVIMAGKKKRKRESLVYKVTFDNKREAIARIEYLIDQHGEDTPYTACKGCEMCDEIEDIRKSFMGEVVGKINQKRTSGYKKRVLTDEIKGKIYDLLNEGSDVRTISQKLSVSLNTVEFYRREWVRSQNDAQQD